MDYQIRLVEKEDIVNGKGFFETLKYLTTIRPLSVDKISELFSLHLSQGSYIFVAESVNKEIIGMVKLLPEPKFSRGGGLVGHIEDVVTREEYESNGVATSLMKTALNIARKIGCYKVILDCDDENIPFYEKFGFIESENHMRLNC